MIALIDYGVGNVGSVSRALDRLGLDYQLTCEAQTLEQADWMLLPGVGSFRLAVEELTRLGLLEPIRELARAGKPYVGLCLGMQLLADFGHEGGGCPGLGLIPGEVKPIQPAGDLRVPHMGWNEVSGAIEDYGLPDRNFYFMHGYHFEVADAGSVTGRVDYGGPLVAAVRQGNLVGFQFHPEKSQAAGMALLRAVLC